MRQGFAAISFVVLAAWLMAAALVRPAVAGPFEDGLSAYARSDYTTAMRLFRPLADQGNADAQWMLGVMYDDGRGVEKNTTEAIRWYRKAADQGDAGAQNNLGLMYDNGQGVPQDYVQAHMWFNLAASRFPASEKEPRDNAVRNRDFVAAKMTPAQIAEAQKLAREWKPKPGTK